MPKDPNYLDANYYYGFISFNDHNYSDALEAFTVVEDHERYKKVVPYYISTIRYSLKQEDRAIEYAENKLKNSSGQYYDLEMRQLVGHGYFQKKQFDKALPYLEAYVTQAKKVSWQDLYELSYSYYYTNNLPKAIEGFKQLGGKEDSLAQNAMYLLGDAYLKRTKRLMRVTHFFFVRPTAAMLNRKKYHNLITGNYHTN